MYAERVTSHAGSSLGVQTASAPGFGLVIGLSLAGLILALLVSAYMPVVADVLVMAS